MLDTLSRDVDIVVNPPKEMAESYLSRAHREDTERLQAIQAEHVRRAREAAWNALIPPCAIDTKLEPYGIRYLHPTKGWRSVGKRRFAIRGVI